MHRKLERTSKGTTILLLAALIASVPPVSASPTGDPAAGGTDSPEPASSSSAVAAPAAAPSPELASQLEQLRAGVEAQAKQFEEHNRELASERESLQQALSRIAALEGSLGIKPRADSISAIPEAVVPNSNLTSVATSDPASAQDLSQKLDTLETKLKSFGPFSFGGDFRLRSEPHFGGPSNQSQVRNRERYRARFNINARLNSDISGGLTLATGDINDPITSNQTANQDFTRKPFYLDKAFINYNPHEFSPLTLIGGKFAYPWYRTELTWDNDISPEGVAQKLDWKSDNWHVLRQFGLVGFELPLGESTKANPITAFTSNPPNAQFPYPNSSIKQSVVYGGQIQTRWQLANWLSFTADAAFYNFHNADQIILASQQAYGVGGASSPGVGDYKLGGNTVTNSYMTTTQSFTVPVAPTAGTCTVGNGGTCTTTTVSSYIIGAKFNSKFALLDTIAQFDIKTPSERWPIRLLGDYVQNTEACANDPGVAPVLPTAPPANATITTKQTNGACNSHARRGHWLEARFGRQQEKGDLQFAYTHMLIEREAVLWTFNFSEMRQSSDVLQNRIDAFYQANRNVQFGFTGFIGRPLHPAVTTPPETYLKRLQFDVIYKF